MVVPMLLAVLLQSHDVRTVGDASVRSDVDARTKAIYADLSSAGTRWAALLAVDEPLIVVPGMEPAKESAKLAPSFTDATGAFIDKGRTRIVANVSSAHGKYGVEYYIDDGVLVFVYDSFEFLPERAPASAWTNFRGLQGWERRIYFRDGAVAFQELTGTGAPAADGAALRSEVAAVALRLHSRLTEKNVQQRR